MEALVEESEVMVVVVEAPGDVVEAGSLQDILQEIVKQGQRMESRLCALGEALLTSKAFIISVPALGPTAPAPADDQDSS